MGGPASSRLECRTAAPGQDNWGQAKVFLFHKQHIIQSMLSALRPPAAAPRWLAGIGFAGEALNRQPIVHSQTSGDDS